jgi:hypothetical protein
MTDTAWMFHRWHKAARATVEIETAMNAAFPVGTQLSKYKEKARSLSFSIVANAKLRGELLDGVVSGERLGQTGE